MSRAYYPNLTNRILKRAVKDLGLPISVFEEPVFSSQEELFDEAIGGIRNSLSLANKEAERGEDEFFQWQGDIKSAVVKDIKDHPDYEDFNTAKLDKIDFSISGNPYIPDNEGRLLFSVDLRKANFQVFRHFAPSIVNHAKDWNSFFEGYTESKYLLNSKRFRQIIFGELNPKRQMAYQKLLMMTVKDFVEEYLGELFQGFIASSPDELMGIITPCQGFYLFNEVNESLTDLKRDLMDKENIEVHFDIFEIIQIRPHPYYRKNSLLDPFKKEIKGVPGVFAPQVWRHCLGKTIRKEDLAFYYEKHLSYFDKPLEFL